MFRHILVLLDGSGCAELALPVAARLARATGASLTLLRMMTLPSDFVWSKLEPPFRDREILTMEMRNASTYLKGKAWEMEVAGIPVQTHLLPGLALQHMHAFIEEQGVDLIVMCSRGQIPFRRRAQRSMAWQVLQESSVPVLVLQETFGQEGTLSFQGARPVRIMVPLDGSVLAETALPPAADLSAALSAPSRGTLHLVSVLPFSSFSEVEETSPSLAQRAWNNRWAYLQATSQALREGIIGRSNLSVTTSVLTHPDVAEAIVHAAAMKRHGVETDHAEAVCDIIALTTHGCSGLRHLRVGSTAERILQETHLPLLVVHPALGERQASKTGATTLASCEREAGSDECFHTR